MRTCLPLILILLITGAMTLATGEDVGEDEYPADPSLVMPDSVLVFIQERFTAVESILRSSCYDCHSAHTEYPWYHSLPVVGSVLDDHIEEGREHLDFGDGFPFAGGDSQIQLLSSIREEIESGDMPLLGYRLMHWDSPITGDPRDSVFSWIDETIGFLRLGVLSR